MARAAFPLRFDDDSVRDALDEVSKQTGTSMNRLILDAVAVQLDLSIRVLEQRLERVMENLRSYKGTWSEREISAFAHAEVDEEDPAEGRMVGGREADPFASVTDLADSLG